MSYNNPPIGPPQVPQQGPPNPGQPNFNQGPPGYPPPMFYPVPMQPQQPSFFSRFGSAILITLGTTLFGLSLLLNFWLLVAFAAKSNTGSSQFGSTQEIVLRPGDASQRVMILKFSGTILDQSAKQFIDLLETVAKDSTVKAIVIEVDSPGGGVTASDELYSAILRAKKMRGVPVLVSMSSIAASGGLYMAMAADEVYAQRTTLTGSIGVILSRMDLSGLGEKYGVKDGSIVSDGATFKNAGSMWTPLKMEEEDYLKSVINDSFATFKSVVVAGRGTKLTKPIDQIAVGKVFSAQQALALGLIDGDNQYLNDVIDKAVAKIGVTGVGVNNPSVVWLKRDPGFFELLSGQGGSSKAGLESSLEKLIHDAKTPRLMYLWDGR